MSICVFMYMYMCGCKPMYVFKGLGAFVGARVHECVRERACV